MEREIVAKEIADAGYRLRFSIGKPFRDSDSLLSVGLERNEGAHRWWQCYFVACVFGWKFQAGWLYDYEGPV